MKEQGRKKQRRYKSWMKGMFSASLVCSFLTILTGCGFAKTGTPTAGTESVIQETVDAEESDGATEQVSELAVYVCGAVQAPGVYHLEQGSRIVDAITVAGGFDEEADTTSLNQAERLEDGQKLYVPTLEEVQKSNSGPQEVTEDKIDINHATKEQLMTLAGIGPSKAEEILAYREEHGGFQSIEELKQINGIKDGVFEKIKDSITVG